MKFDKAAFEYHGGYLTYKGEFVARFKYRGPVGKAAFIRLLTKYYTVEEYFARVASEAPYKILMNDGLLRFDAENRRFLVSK